MLLFLAITVGVSAVEPCQRAVKRVITEVKWPHYSRATVARWVAWGKAHPNYVPPKRRPIVTTREIEDMLAFDCAMPALESGPVETAMLEQTPDETLALNVDAPKLFSVETDSPIPTAALLNQPVQELALPTGQTPEPQTWLFLLTGVACLGLLRRFGQRPEHPVAVSL